MRFKKAGATAQGKEFDLVVRALDTEDPYSSFEPDLNHAAGRGFQINLGVTAKSDKQKSLTEFEISFEDQQGKPVDLDATFYLLDLDHDHKDTLREEACYDLDTIDLESSKIPGFNTNTMELEAEAILPGFSSSQLTTMYNKDQNCDGTLQTTHGSVTIESNQVGFQCDLPVDVALQDFKPIKCVDDCFSEAKCMKRKKFFGPVDADGNTCIPSAPGCDFERGIDPLTRVVKTHYEGRSSFRISLGIACLKDEGETCSRNFVFQADYRKCKCEETETTSFEINESMLEVNNLGGVGPDTNATQELRYKHAGRTRQGQWFDLVAVVADDHVYHSTELSKDYNGVSGELGIINVGSIVTSENNGIQMTDITFTVEDSFTGDEIILDNYAMSFLDFDVNRARNLNERLCINLDAIDESLSVFPPTTSDVTAEQSQVGCNGETSQSGSVTLESTGVGFLCDNPTSLDDLSDVDCGQCDIFTEAQCAKPKIDQFFPIQRDQRTLKIALVSTSKFTISLGVHCLKGEGEGCNRNFLFTASHDRCKAPPMTTAATTTTMAPTTMAPTTMAPTTMAPTTMAPTTMAPTTMAPTTAPPTTTADPTTLFTLVSDTGKQCKDTQSLGYLEEDSATQPTLNDCLSSCLSTDSCTAVIYYTRSDWCSLFESMCEEFTKAAKNSLTYVLKSV